MTAQELREALLKELEWLERGLPRNSLSAAGYNWALGDIRRFLDRVRL